MKKESKNWIIIPNRSIIRYGKIARLQREVYKLDRGSSAMIKCEDCDEGVTVDKDDYKKKWTIYLRKAQVEKDVHDGYSFNTRIEFYCPNCQDDTIETRRFKEPKY